MGSRHTQRLMGANRRVQAKPGRPNWAPRVLARLFPTFERLGFHVTRNHFYEPVPELASIADGWFDRVFDMPGVDMQDEGQRALVTQIMQFDDEYTSFPHEPVDDDPFAYHVDNGQFGAVDAEVLYSLIRLRRPRRLIEIGSGFSTLISRAAMTANRAEDPSYSGELTCIEPYPRGFLALLSDVEVETTRVQDLQLDRFDDLESGDILFIDSSHVLKIGSDVQFEFLELLPRLPVGVMVQVHDIWFPKDYPRVFVKQWHRFWTEQYLLQAFLAFNSCFEVRWCSSWMFHHHPDLLSDAFPSLVRPGLRPSSLWMERVA